MPRSRKSASPLAWPAFSLIAPFTCLTLPFILSLVLDFMQSNRTRLARLEPDWIPVRIVALADSICRCDGGYYSANLMPYKNITPPAGDKISTSQGKLNVPDQPVIPFIRGDGTGPDIWAASVRVFDAAVEKAYGGKKKISWFEVFAGQAAKDKFDEWLPDDTVEAFREYLVGIKGPLTTPVGGGISSLNVALRQLLDLFVCLRPVQYFTGVPSPVKHPEKVDMVIFRENTEDIYAGIEWAAGSDGSKKVLDFLAEGISEGVRQDPLRHEGEGGGVLENESGRRKAMTFWWASASNRSAARAACA